ncbi:MAG: GDP-L-fucose synthase [Gammaproteobacteria bacterium]|nr:GDP-L-fucose synthase [Gammaproteobacteria bacterium]
MIAKDSPLKPESKIYVAGHRGMVGSAILRRLHAEGFNNTIICRHGELDLSDQHAVNDFFATQRPDYVVLAAAKVGGIQANNTHPAEFIYINLMIQANVIHAAYRHGVDRLLFLGSSCIYPRLAEQPMGEEALLTGGLEPTNESYAVAKIAGIKLCEAYNRQYGTNYRSVMPTNLYGPGDNFDLENSHVLPALIRKCHDAKLQGAARFEVWGTGTPRREFLHVDDLASACRFVMALDDASYAASTQPMRSHLNVGTGKDVTIKELAQLVGEIVGFQGDIIFNPARPDGAPRKLLNIDRIKALGWQPNIGLRDGLEDTCQWFLDHRGSST